MFVNVRFIFKKARRVLSRFNGFRQIVFKQYPRSVKLISYASTSTLLVY